VLVSSSYSLCPLSGCAGEQFIFPLSQERVFTSVLFGVHCKKLSSFEELCQGEHNSKYTTVSTARQCLALSFCWIGE